MACTVAESPSESGLSIAPIAFLDSLRRCSTAVLAHLSQLKRNWRNQASLIDRRTSVIGIFQQLRRSMSPRLPTDEPVQCNNGNKQLDIGQRPHKQQRHLFHLGKGGNCCPRKHSE